VLPVVGSWAAAAAAEQASSSTGAAADTSAAAGTSSTTRCRSSNSSYGAISNSLCRPLLSRGYTTPAYDVIIKAFFGTLRLMMLSLKLFLVGGATLEGGSRVEELAAAGYPAQEAAQQVDAVLAVLEQFGEVTDAAAAVATLGKVAQALQALGLVLSTLAVSYACNCNNPRCCSGSGSSSSSMAGRTELESVSGRSCICAGCLVARYCCRGCQKAHWKQHKPVCKALAAATASAAAVAEAPA
jgi:hypothetical protein